ncbi:unnamed protein product, partial [Cylicostephanus goldi]
MLTAKDQNMLNDEYVYIFADLLDSGYRIANTGNQTLYVWEDRSIKPDGRDKEAREAFERTFMLSDVDNDFD